MGRCKDGGDSTLLHTSKLLGSHMWQSRKGAVTTCFTVHLLVLAQVSLFKQGAGCQGCNLR